MSLQNVVEDFKIDSCRIYAFFAYAHLNHLYKKINTTLYTTENYRQQSTNYEIFHAYTLSLSSNFNWRNQWKLHISITNWNKKILCFRCKGLPDFIHLLHIHVCWVCNFSYLLSYEYWLKLCSNLTSAQLHSIFY